MLQCSVDLSAFYKNNHSPITQSQYDVTIFIVMLTEKKIWPLTLCMLAAIIGICNSASDQVPSCLPFRQYFLKIWRESVEV